MNKINIPTSHNIDWGKDLNYEIKDIVLSLFNKGYFFNPYEFRTSTFLPLLDKIDKTDSINKKTFIPLEYLEDKGIYDKDDKDIVTINLNDKFKGIPLKILKKNYLKQTIIKSYNPYNIYKEDVNEDEIYFDFKITPEINTYSSWLDVYTLNKFLLKLTYLFDNVFIYDCIIPYFTDTTEDLELNICFKYLESTLKKSDFMIKDKNIIVIPILYRSHFTVCIYNKLDRIICFFDSGGIQNYKPIFLKDKCIYITNNLRFKKISHSKYYKPYFCYYLYNAILEWFFINKISVEYSIFNNFRIQHENSECGMFVITFIYQYFYFFDKIRTYNNGHQYLKSIYYSMFNKSDRIMSYLRGTLFITKDDLIRNNITLDIYKKSHKVYNIKNDYFLEYMYKIKKVLNSCKNIELY